jgi:hypothetical protein
MMVTHDAELEMAFAVHRNPGAYVIFVGAGVSRSAGIPTAWDVLRSLVREAATIAGENPADEIAWYEKRYGTEPQYDTLLDKLTNTPSERQALLKQFFEANEEQRELGEKKPSAGHRAIARLVASGHVRIVVTLNFDHLIEDALREEGISPTVVSSAQELEAIDPLHSQKALVVHLHGDYLNPQSMLNTPSELEAYGAATSGFVRQIASEYGLILSGWSAQWDTALRQILLTTSNRFYSAWWIDIAPLSVIGEQLRERRHASFINASTDDALGGLADAVDSLNDLRPRHPITRRMAVSSAKRALRGSTRAIPLHDEFKFEVERLRENDLIRVPNFNAQDPHVETPRRLGAFLETTDVLTALTATCSYWGTEETDRWWIDAIGDFAAHDGTNGLTDLLDLQRFPATALLYAGGIAAVAAGRLIADLTVVDRDRGAVSAADHLAPMRVIPGDFGSGYIFDSFYKLFVTDLGIGEASYESAWEMFLYLREVQETYERYTAAGTLIQLVPFVEAAWDSLPGGPTYMSRGSNPAEISLRKQLEGYYSLAHGQPHLKSMGYGSHYYPRVSVNLRRDLQREAHDHPLVRAGFCAGDLEGLKAAITVADESLANLAKFVADRNQPNDRAYFKSTSAFWIDHSRPAHPTRPR